MLAGDVKDVLLLDVTPLSLGIETKGGVFTRLIERNTTIPTRKSEIFSTAEDSQPSVEVHVLQGEREMATYNKSLGKFQLTGIPPAPRGIPQIEVTFDIDADGILHVSAKDLGTGTEQKIEIKAGSGLSDQDIEQMVKDAESHAADDARLRELAETRNTADNAAYQAEKQLGELGDQVDAGARSEIENAIAEVRSALEGDDAEAIKSKTDALQQAFHSVSEKIYQQAAAAQEPTTNGAPPTRKLLTPRSWTRGRSNAGRDRSLRATRRGPPATKTGCRRTPPPLRPSRPTPPSSRERDEYLDLAKRTKAEFENFRKRVARQEAEAEMRGARRVRPSLVPVLDNLERALTAPPIRRRITLPRACGSCVTSWWPCSRGPASRATRPPASSSIRTGTRRCSLVPVTRGRYSKCSRRATG